MFVLPEFKVHLCIAIILPVPVRHAEGGSPPEDFTASLGRNLSKSGYVSDRWKEGHLLLLLSLFSSSYDWSRTDLPENVERETTFFRALTCF